jgi:nicotinamidase-related amidase
MPKQPTDLYGNTPDTCPTALLIIDMINDMEFEGGEEMIRHALPAARALVRLKTDAKATGIPVIYVNDNFGRWRSNFEHLIEHCLKDNVRGREMVKLLRPEENDYFVLKPKHSGFFHTPLQLLLQHLNVERLILTGITADICVLFSAYDAYMRDYKLHVPRYCVASRRDVETEHALELIERVLKADIRPSPELDLRSMVHYEEDKAKDKKRVPISPQSYSPSPPHEQNALNC